VFQGIINEEVFETCLTPEEKDRLLLLLPEVDRHNRQALTECLRFNTHFNNGLQVCAFFPLTPLLFMLCWFMSTSHSPLSFSATKQYQQLQRAGHFETGAADVPFFPSRPLDPWKVRLPPCLNNRMNRLTKGEMLQAKYFEEYWGQRLGLPPPLDTRLNTEMELPPLTQENLNRLAFSFSLGTAAPSSKAVQEDRINEVVSARRRKLDFSLSEVRDPKEEGSFLAEGSTLS